MTTITIELTDEQAQLLSNEAERLHLPIQDFAARKLSIPWQSEETAATVNFDEAMDYVFQKNSELYRRLA